jgi:hypothetical protein
LFRNTTNIISFATNGNAGIGTTSPSYKLDVSGNFRARSDNVHSIGHSTTDTRLDIFACHRRGVATGGWVSFDPNGGTTGSSGLHIYDELDVNGSVTIGNLNVNGAGSFTGSVHVNRGGAGTTPQINVSPNANTAESSIGFWQNTNNSGALWVVGHNPSGVGNNNFSIYSSTYGGNALSILNNGNVGINTNSPTEKLNVNGNIDLFGTVRIGGSSSSSAFLINLGTAGVGNFRSGFLFGDGTNMLLSNQQNGFLTFATNNTTRVEIAANGRVTMGGNNGGYPLTVFGSSNSGSIAGYAGWHGNYVWQNQTTSYDVSIYGQNFIMAGQGFVSLSDQRMKKDIIDIEDGESLNIIRQIQPKRYRYIDEYKRGTDYVYGFIAQQVREVLPAASGLVKDVIPSIITPATVSYDSVNDITTVSLVDNKQHNLTSENSNSRVRFFDENDTNTDLELHEIVSGNIFKVKGELKGTNTFVYGLEVEDFHTLNKDVIFTVALAALQQVDKELQETKQTVNDLLQRIQALENARN